MPLQNSFERPVYIWIKLVPYSCGDFHALIDLGVLALSRTCSQIRFSTRTCKAYYNQGSSETSPYSVAQPPYVPWRRTFTHEDISRDIAIPTPRLFRPCCNVKAAVLLSSDPPDWVELLTTGRFTGGMTLYRYRSILFQRYP